MILYRQHKNAFSLIELSIVIVIIATILFLVIRSSDISETAKIKLLGKEVANLQHVSDSFFEQYSFWAGDFPNASDYFSCTAGAAPTGCDGNGNNFIDSKNESYRFWEHLKLAGFLEHNYSGIKNGSEPYTSSSNSYSSDAISSGLYYAHNDAANDEYPNKEHNKLTLGRFVESYAEAQIGALTPKDAMNYDLKYDDGKPRLGKVMARTFLNLSNNRQGIATELCRSNIASNSIADISGGSYNSSSDLELCELVLFLE